MANLPDEVLTAKIKVDDSELDKVKLAMKQLRSEFKNGVKLDVDVDTKNVGKLKAEMEALRKTSGKPIKIPVDNSGLDATKSKALSLGSALNTSSKGLGALSKGLGSLSSTLNIVSAGLQNLGNNMQMIGRVGMIASTVLGGAVVGGMTKIASVGIKAALSVQSVEAQLKAQNVSGSKVSSMMKEMTDYANNSAFSLDNLGSSISSVNSYVGDIDKSEKVVKTFGTSLMATGRSADDLQNVAVNLGQLNSSGFTKADFKELIRGVPAISQALRDMDISSYEDFNEALGDDPNTKTIERTANALDLVTGALDKYNTKTNAFEESQKPLKAQWENFTGTIETNLGAMAKSSGLIDALGIAMNNLGKMFDKNSGSIEGFYKWLGKMVIKSSDFLADFDFQKAFNSFSKGISSAVKTVKSTLDSLSGDAEGIYHKFSQGKTGAEGFGTALSNIVKGSAGLYFGGTLVKGISSIISLLSVGAGLASKFAGGLSKVTASASKISGSKAMSSLLGGSKSKTKIDTGAVDLENVIGKTAQKQMKLPTMTIDSMDYVNQMNKNSTGLKQAKRSTESVVGTLSETTGSMSRVERNMSPVRNAITSMNGKFKTMFSSLGNLGSGVANVAKTGVGKVKGMLKSVASGLAGTGQDILLITLAMKEFDNLPSIGTIMTGFGKVAAVMGSMSVLNVVTSGVNKWLGLDEAVGAIANFLNAGSLVAMATGIKALKNLPSGGAIKSGMLKLTAVSVAMAGLNTVTGLVGVAGGGLGSLMNTIGAFTNAINAGSILALTKAMRSLENLPSMSSVESSLTKLKKLSSKMTEVTESFSMNFGKSLLKRWDSNNVTKIVTNLSKMASSFDKINDIKVPSTDKVQQLNDAIKKLVKGFTLKANNLDIKDQIAKEVQSIIKNISAMGQALNKISSIKVPSPEVIGTLKQSIQNSLNAISEIQNMTLTGEKEKTTTKDMKNMASFTKPINDIISDVSSMGTALQQLQGLALNTTKIATNVSATMTAMRDTIQQVKNAMSDFSMSKSKTGGTSETAEGDKKFTSKGEISNMTSILTSVTKMISELGLLQSALSTVQNQALNVDTIAKNVGTTMTAMRSSIETMKNAMNVISTDKSLGDAGITGTDVSAEESGLGGLTSIGEMGAMTSVLKSVTSMISELSLLQGALVKVQNQALNVKVIAENTQSTANAMKQAISILKTTLSSFSTDTATTDKPLPATGANFNGAPAQSGDVTSMGDLGAIVKIIDKIKSVMTKVSELQGILVEVQKAKVAADQVKAAMNQLVLSLGEILNTFKGQNLQDMAHDASSEGVKSAIDGIKTFVNSVKTALTDIGNLAPTANSKGSNLATEVINGFKSGDWGALKTRVQSALEGMNAIGQKAGSALKSGFNSGVAGMADSAVTQINKVKNALTSIPKSISVSINISSNIESVISQISRAQSMKVKKHDGGMIGYFSKGGSVGSMPFGNYANGTDKIPAMLTQGEYVQNRNAVSFWGKGLMDAMNQRNVNRVSQLMSSRLGSASKNYSTYNTVNNNQRNTVNQTFSGNGSKQYRNLSRLVKG